MNKFLTLATFAGLACTVAVAQPSKWGKLKLVDNQLSSENGEAIQLKGFSTFSIHYEEGTACLDDFHFKAMQAWNCNTVRIAMYVDEVGGGYVQNSVNQTADAKKYVKRALQNDMYAVMDWHILEVGGRNSNGNPGDPNTYINEAKTFFADFSKWVVENGYDGKVIYELCNEPSMGVNFKDKIKPYCQTIMDVVLKNDPGALFILGTEGWCQKVFEATKTGVDSKYKSHALFSFHYYACSHEYLLGDFSNACSNAPVIVSEWSTVSFDGDGHSCISSANRLLGLCEGQNNGEQKVSWFFWNWGRKNEGSTVFTADCSNPSDNSKLSVAGKYIVEMLNGGEIPEVPRPSGYAKRNIIVAHPTLTDEPFDWSFYDTGGEGVAYHDGDGAAYDKNTKDGFYVGYKSGGDEVDCFSQGRNYETKGGKLGMNPNFTYGKGDDEAPTAWNDNDALCVGYDWTAGQCKDGMNLYKSLNAGLGYCKDLKFFGAENLIVAGEKFGEVDNGRAFGGVDVSKCSGITKSNKYNSGSYKYANICSVEPNEWISYTVDVEKAGYYKVHFMYSGQTNAEGMVGFSLNGKGGGNIVRDLADKSDFSKPALTTLPGNTKLGAEDYENWEWSTLDFLDSDYGDNGVVVFKRQGEQSITISFVTANGNTGPLMFELVDDDISEELAHEAEMTAADNSAVVVYPNPTSGEFTINLGTTEAANVQVVNMAGQVVYSVATNGETEVVVNKALASGIYTVVVASEAGVRTTKLQVQ